MRRKTAPSLGWRRGIALTGVIALGFIAIAGSGGGGVVSVEGGNCGILFSNSCTITGSPVFVPNVAFVSPQRTTIQVGGTATFTVDTNVTEASYQWRRSADGGASYVDIAGATQSSYTVAVAQLTDDETIFSIDVRQSGTSVVQATALLTVSSMPGVVFEDGEFLAGDWAAAAAPDAAASGATHGEEQVATGGNPDAFRKMVFALPPGPSMLRVFNTAQTHIYDPSTQGAIHVIDYTEDCIVTDGTASPGYAVSSLLIEQGDRKYLSIANDSCTADHWISPPILTSLREVDFARVDGPACNAGESCPDFSGNALPLRFGYARDTQQFAGNPAGSITHGIDNWKVTVWRH